MCPQRKDNRMKVKDDLSIAEKIKAESLSIQHHALHISESMTSYARYNELTVKGRVRGSYRNVARN